MFYMDSRVGAVEVGPQGWRTQDGTGTSRPVRGG